MGGEWEFNITGNFAKFNLETYQKMLRELKDQYQGKIPEGSEFWCNDGSMPPADNVFAKFTYTCSRHTNWGSAGHSPYWILFWDPTVVTKENRQSNVHGRCAGEDFKKVSSEIMKKLVKEFPWSFDLDWGDGPSGYGLEYDAYGDPDDHYGEEQPDYTACDKECGYCGKCDY